MNIFTVDGVTAGPRKSTKRVSEPVDEWLHNEGFFRKHCPKDPTCLFRAVSEQIYLTQHFHIRVRNECVDFMRKNRHLFEEKISILYESYLEQMACFTEWGGAHEIEAMSLMYERDIIIFDGHSLTKNSVSNHGNNKFIFLCFTSQKQYESVYTQEFISTAAYCQSLVYQSLYKDVFGMENVDETVHKMLHDRTHSYRHDKSFSKGNLENRETLTTELLSKMEEGGTETDEMKMINKGHTPFPYRVAKALDPDIYRNTDFDIWHEIRREVKNSGWTKFSGMEFQVGGKCLVDLNIKKDDLANNNDLSHLIANKNEYSDETDSEGRDLILLSGHIQEMTKNEGPVVVFILEFGEKRTVPYSSLRPIPAKKVKPSGPVTIPKKNSNIEQSPKIKKSWSPNARKGKDQINGNPPPLTFERNANKPTPKRNDNGIKWANESSESSKVTFGKQCTDKFSPTDDFTVDLDFSEEGEKNVIPLYNEANDENLKTSSPPNAIPATGPENNFQLPPQQQNTTYFLPPTENNNYPVYPYCEMLPNIGYLLDQVSQPINLSVPKSNDVNASDLPFTDLQTLRFFYNLGLQYFHAVDWLCGPNPPPIINGHYTAPDNSAGQKSANSPVSHEDMTQIANNMYHKNVLRSKKENPENGGRGSATQKLPKNSNVRFNGIHEPRMQSNPHKNGKDHNKNAQFSNNDSRAKEHVNALRDAQRNPRNGLAPRFKKCVEGRNRNFTQPSRRCQQRETDFHQGNRFPGSNKMEGQTKQYERNGGGQGSRQNQFPHQVPMQVNGPPYLYPPNQPAMYQHSMCNEGEPYCQGNPGLVPIPYIHQVDSGDNNANPFPPMIYTGIDNYPQAYVPYYPPYAYPPQTVYPGMAPANAQENWYQYPGHSHYIPSCVQFNPSPGTPPNGAM